MKAVYHILVAATKVPGLIFCSGQTPIDGSGKLVPGGIKEHTLEKVLIHSGASLKNVVKVNIFLKNMDDFAAVNEVYEAALPNPKASQPARSCFQAGKLPNDVIVEIECIASV
ncbi:hypothetical protein RQP46_003085 [Phenoliferia psychrophenolica]